MRQLRIASFLPSGSELACSLGLDEQLVGISHECNFPASVLGKPVVVHAALPFHTMTPDAIDRAVTEQLQNGESLYQVDLALLREVAPTHILTQDLCQVCAPAGNEVRRALAALPHKPEIIWMSPHSLADIYGDLRRLAHATGTTERAEYLIRDAEARLKKIRASLQTIPRPRPVFCMEWSDPIYCSGHWVPELVEIAGGIDLLGRKWADSVRVPLEELKRVDPEVVVAMPCGYALEAAAIEARKFAAALNRFSGRPKIFAVDAGYFSRPTLRAIDGAELLAHLFWPGLAQWNGAAFQQITNDATCPRCLRTFSCEVQDIAHCWCAGLPPIQHPNKQEGCLCPECLTRTPKFEGLRWCKI